MRYQNYKKNLKRNNNIYICRECSVALKTGKETLIELRTPGEIAETNRSKRRKKYNMTKKQRKKYTRTWDRGKPRKRP